MLLRLVVSRGCRGASGTEGAAGLQIRPTLPLLQVHYNSQLPMTQARSSRFLDFASLDFVLLSLSLNRLMTTQSNPDLLRQEQLRPQSNRVGYHVNSTGANSVPIDPTSSHFPVPAPTSDRSKRPVTSESRPNNINWPRDK